MPGGQEPSAANIMETEGGMKPYGHLTELWRSGEGPLTPIERCLFLSRSQEKPRVVNGSAFSVNTVGGQEAGASG